MRASIHQRWWIGCVRHFISKCVIINWWNAWYVPAMWMAIYAPAHCRRTSIEPCPKTKQRKKLPLFFSDRWTCPAVRHIVCCRHPLEVDNDTAHTWINSLHSMCLYTHFRPKTQLIDHIGNVFSMFLADNCQLYVVFSSIRQIQSCCSNCCFNARCVEIRLVQLEFYRRRQAEAHKWENC